MSFQIGDCVGDYYIIGLLGAGGMGKVYKVKNQISDRVEAMKVLLPDLSDNQELADRFIREIKVLASLNHPNIASLRTAFHLQNQLLMVMEFVEGTSLDERIKQGPVPTEDAVSYTRQVLAALAYAHQRGVVHRDIKPANMMLTPDKVIKLMDFGIAKSKTDEKLTQTGTAMGSLFYMSPEQVQGGALDSRADLYSVGVSLYELVTGTRPFQGSSQFDLMVAQLRQAPVPPIERVPNLPKPLNDVIMIALEKQPDKRFQTAEAFSAALELITSARRSPVAPIAADPTLAGVPNVRSNTPVPVASSVATTRSRSSPLIKFLVPLLAGVAIITALVLLLRHPQKRAQNPAVSSAPVRPSLLSLASGDMVYVPAGDALLGKDLKQVFVGDFYIDKTEVTNRAFLDFCRGRGQVPPKGTELLPRENPVVNVTADEARSFCGWAQKRLPTADEWEKAARGPKGQPFPWGSQFDYSDANVPRDNSAAKTAKLAPAASYESGKSPYGALNMMGNAWEWVDTAAPAPTDQEFREYQRIFRDLLPPLSATEPFYYARGGSYQFVDDTPAELISDPGSPLPARARKPDVGFRCAMDVKN